MSALTLSRDAVRVAELVEQELAAFEKPVRELGAVKGSGCPSTDRGVIPPASEAVTAPGRIRTDEP